MSVAVCITKQRYIKINNNKMIIKIMFIKNLNRMEISIYNHDAPLINPTILLQCGDY